MTIRIISVLGEIVRRVLLGVDETNIENSVFLEGFKKTRDVIRSRFIAKEDDFLIEPSEYLESVNSFNGICVYGIF